MKTVNIATQEEEESIRNISSSIEQINRVVQSNTANSTESAETSRALSVQADNLKSLMANFQCAEGSEE